MDVDHTTELGCDTPVMLLGLEGTLSSQQDDLLKTLVAEQIACRSGPLTSRDIRFLRTYLGLNTRVHRKPNLHANVLPPEDEAYLRYEVCSGIEGVETSKEELLALIARDLDPNFQINIDVSDSTCYRVLVAA